jgi:hypothetical protein
LKENLSLELHPKGKLAESLVKEALSSLKQDVINGTIDYIKKEIQAIETCDHEIERWERMRGHHMLRIEALKAGEFSVGYRGELSFNQKELNGAAK